nr:hypothetical protein [Victivallis vadensis]
MRYFSGGLHNDYISGHRDQAFSIELFEFNFIEKPRLVVPFHKGGDRLSVPAGIETAPIEIFRLSILAGFARLADRKKMPGKIEFHFEPCPFLKYRHHGFCNLPDCDIAHRGPVILLLNFDEILPNLAALFVTFQHCDVLGGVQRDDVFGFRSSACREVFNIFVRNIILPLDKTFEAVFDPIAELAFASKKLPEVAGIDGVHGFVIDGDSHDFYKFVHDEFLSQLI